MYYLLSNFGVSIYLSKILFTRMVELTGSLCIVFVEMLGEITFLYKLSTTFVAVIGIFSMMYFEMPGQMTFLKILFVTLVAMIWSAIISSQMDG